MEPPYYCGGQGRGKTGQMGWLPRQLLQRWKRHSDQTPLSFSTAPDPSASGQPSADGKPQQRAGIDRRGWTLGTVLVAGGVTVIAGSLLSDQLLRRSYDSWRPALEKQISSLIGHPLHLGPYGGLNLAGVGIGPSRIEGGRLESSTASIEGLQVSIDPAASLVRQQLVIDLQIAGARLDLRPNDKGQFWALPKLPAGRDAPPLRYRFRFRDPVQLQWHRLERPSAPLKLQLTGQVQLAPRDHHIHAKLRAWMAGIGGEVDLVGTGDWRDHLWRLDLQPRQLDLQAARSLLPAGLLLQGQASGALHVSLNQGRRGCHGTVTLNGLRLRRRGMDQALESASLPLRCQANGLQLARSPWRFGAWRGQISGSLTGRRQLRAVVTALPPKGFQALKGPIQGSLVGRWIGGRLQSEQIRLRSGSSRLEAHGLIGSELALQGSWSLAPAELLGRPPLPAWLGRTPIRGVFALTGPLGSPQLALETGRQKSHPLLGSWQAAVAWRQGVLRMERFSSGPLQARATLPLRFSRQGLRLGALEAWIDLRDLPLSSLDGLVGTQLHGRLDAHGWLRGPLSAPVPDLQLSLRDPGAGPLQLREHWQGQLLGETGGGAQLQLQAEAGAIPGRISASLTPRWLPTRFQWDRAGGQLALSGTPRLFRWTARDLPLQGLEWLVDRIHPPQPLLGRLGGNGELSLQPLGFNGRVRIAEPGLFGLGARQLSADLHYADRRYRIRAALQPLSPGTLQADLEGRWQGSLEARIQARDLSSLLAQELASAWQLWKQGRSPGASRGRATDLGTPAIATLGLALEQQLQVLDQAREKLAAFEQRQQQRDRASRLAALQMRVDADLSLSGPNLRKLRADLEARGHLWLSARDRDLALARDPFEVKLQGPLSDGQGTFALKGLSLALLSLLTPVPETLRGYLGAQGRYRLGGQRPELAMELALDQAQLGERGLSLERGGLKLGAKGLTVDLSLRAAGTSGSLDLAGLLPLDADSEELKLRLASRGDGLGFLSDLAGPGLRWRGGDVDVQLLMRGSLKDPIANGFLRVRNGAYDLAGQPLRDVQATVVFDFQQLLLQELQAKVGASGSISGDGKLGLVHPLEEDPTLTVKLQQVPLKQERLSALADGRLEIAGSLTAPKLGGDIRISQGTINASPAQITQGGGGAAGGKGVSGAAAQATSNANDLLQRRWDYQKPLVLLGPTLNSATARSLEESLPRLPWLEFDGLRLSFGPNLRIVLPAIANFTTGGSLRLSGPLSPDLRASGVVRLLKGRLNLFTSTFSLDPDTPNVAVFTPSLGLVPYLDIAMRSRIADNRTLPLSSSLSTGETTALPILSEKDNPSGFTNFNQLNLILVTVSVSGPADELARNIRLRSTPPLPQERLLALIGGNSLAGLQGGEAGTALATALGQSLLSPLLGSITDALGQRVSLALYPTYVNQAISDGALTNGKRVAPQLVLAAEVGYDLTNRLNASLLAAPNRSDVPPQFNLNYKATNNLSIEGSVDTEGTWQTQLQLFLRF